MVEKIALLQYLPLLLINFLLLSGCTAPNYVWPAYDKISLFASTDVNPDDNNRPSPIQVKIYELAARTTFDNLDFQSLFANGSTLLSVELISEKTFIIQPNETLEYKIELNKEVTYIAIVAAYRQIDKARWKHIYPVKSYGYYKHAIVFSHNAIEIQKYERTKNSEDKGRGKKQRKSNDKVNRNTNKNDAKESNESEESIKNDKYQKT